MDGVNKVDEVRKYNKITVLEHWLFMIAIFGLMATAFPVFLNWFLPEIAIFDVVFPTLPIITLALGSMAFSIDHNLFGYLLVGLSIVHVVFHIGSKDNSIIIPRTKDVKMELRSLIHSLFYFIGLFRSEESGGGEKIVARQRANYLLLLFSIGILVLTGLMLIIPPPENILTYHTIFSTHVLAATVSVLIILVHLAFVIRNHDLVSLKTIFVSGTVPLSYIKQKKLAWLKSLSKEADTTTTEIIANEPEEKLAVELLDFYETAYDENDVQILAGEIKKEMSVEDRARLITVSEIL